MQTVKDIVTKYESFVVFLQSLKDVDDNCFYRPIAEHKWSIAAIVSHFKAWDQYMLMERLPLMKSGAVLPPAYIDVDELNKQAETYAHSGVTKEDLINEVTAKRKEVVSFIKNLDEDQLFESFVINGKTYTMVDYIQGLTDHDHQHQKQIEAFLKVS